MGIARERRNGDRIFIGRVVRGEFLRFRSRYVVVFPDGDAAFQTFADSHSVNASPDGIIVAQFLEEPRLFAQVLFGLGQ